MTGFTGWRCEEDGQENEKIIEDRNLSMIFPHALVIER
jgi:hypothetical protein